MPNCWYFIKFLSKPYVQLDSDLEFTIIQYILYNTIHLYNTVHFTLKRSVKLWFTNHDRVWLLLQTPGGMCLKLGIRTKHKNNTIKVSLMGYQGPSMCLSVCWKRRMCCQKTEQGSPFSKSAAKTARCSNLASNIYLLNPHSACAGCGTVSKWTPGTLLTQNLQSYLWQGWIQKRK